MMLLPMWAESLPDPEYDDYDYWEDDEWYDDAYELAAEYEAVWHQYYYIIEEYYVTLAPFTVEGWE